MAVLTIKSFGGIAPKTPPRYLSDTQAQVALNCPVFTGSIQPLSDVGSSVHTLTKTGTPLTLYRFGQDTVSDTLYWFHWTKDVNVCRSQIAGDASEWTFYTGDGSPKATYNSIALSASNYPAVSRPMGLPAPTEAMVVAAASFDPTAHAAELVLTKYHIEQLDSAYGVLVSTTTDDEAEYTTVALSDPISATSIAAALEAELSTVLTAVVDSDSVAITSLATGIDAKLFVKFQTGTEDDKEADFTLETLPDFSATGTADTDAYVIITDSEIGSVGPSDAISIITDTGVVFEDAALGDFATATTLAAFLNTQAEGKVIATVYGSCVVLTPGTEGSGAEGFIQYTRSAFDIIVADQKVTGSEVAAPAYVFVTQSDVDLLEGKYIKLTVNGTDTILSVPETAYVNSLLALSGYGVSVKLHGSIEPFAIIKTNSVGTSATLAIRGGTYPTKPIFSTQTASGYIDEDETLETRVYTWTWVNKESGFEFESAPAPASSEVEIRYGQNVEISGLAPVPGGAYVVTNRRIYRSVSGTYLFVAEIPAANSSFTDDVTPDLLGEEIPTLTWSEPPSDLSGLINLPNGMMAGFVGRDVYFCDPYHPHAWPESYIQTLDYPVVGFGRMDTTLAVLTTGNPYFIQGTHPSATAVVKSDLEQACVAKRSIVSMNGSVIYAAPDGLMLLSPGGSRIMTASMFTYAQWQTYFKPESIHAYHHDNQYIAFYDNGTTQGGFVFDMTSGQFILHDIYATAGYQDLQRDKLFLAFADKSVKVWGVGSAKNYIWRSKKFTMPQVMGFACAQLEAEAYPVTLRVYADGALIFTKSVESRNPFRLPARVGRDWEMQVEGSSEVFALSLANSMSELANG